MNLTLTPRRLTSTFAVIALCLLLAHGAIQTVRFATGNERVGGLVFFFSVGADTNLPTFYSALAILSCAVLLTIVGAASRGGGEVASGYWYGLAVTFLFLALDEMLELHERLIEPMRSRLDTSGYFYHAWVIPYGLGLVVFVVVYVRFLMCVPRRTAVLFVVAGAIFVAGGLGLEMVGGSYLENHSSDDVPYVLIQTCEEALEMAGIIVFLYAISDYIQQRFRDLSVRFA